MTTDQSSPIEHSPVERSPLATGIHVNGRPSGVFSGPVAEEHQHRLPDFSGMSVSYIVHPRSPVPAQVQEPKEQEFIGR